MLIVSTEKRDIYRNLALEEYLLDHIKDRGPVLFLSVNAPCVVIGKNQNPWREARLSLMDKEGVSLARRISGGGAVYHDEGNLNVSVIVPRTAYREEKQYELMLKALAGLGITAERLGKNSLAVDGKKFSGQAFCHRRDRSLHHGTLLVNSDLDRLGRYLGPEVDGIETKAITSIPSEVMNLNQAAPDLTIRTLSAALIETFQMMYAPGEVTRPTVAERNVVGRVTSPGVIFWDDKMISEAELSPIIETLSSNDWKFGRTPRFEVTLKGRTLQIEKGCITTIEGKPLFEEWLRTRESV